MYCKLHPCDAKFPLTVSEISVRLCVLKLDFISMAAILNYRENLIAPVEEESLKRI